MKLLEVALTPVVIAIVGLWVENQQTRSNQDLQRQLQAAQAVTAEALQKQQADSTRELKDIELRSTERIAQATQHAALIQIFAEQIVSPKEEDRLRAVRLLGALDPELGKKLLKGVAEDKSQSPPVRALAMSIAERTQNAERADEPRFVSIEKSCRDNIPRESYDGSIPPGEATKACRAAVKTRQPVLGAREDQPSLREWKWHAKWNNVPITCTCDPVP